MDGYYCSRGVWRFRVRPIGRGSYCREYGPQLNGVTLYFERFGNAGAGFVRGSESKSFLAPENR